MSTLKEQHDKLLAEKPEGVEHDEATCSFCNVDESSDTEPEGGDMKTYTEDEFTVAVQEAVAPLQAAADSKVAEIQAKLDALTAESEQSELDSRIAEIQAKLDVSEAEAAAQKQELADVLAYLEAQVAEAVEAARLDDLRSTRRSAIAEATAFSDEQIDEKMDRWIAMDDETFDAILDDFKAVKASAASASEAESKDEARAETAMENVRDQERSTSTMAAILDARSRGLDVRDLNI